MIARTCTILILACLLLPAASAWAGGDDAKPAPAWVRVEEGRAKVAVRFGSEEGQVPGKPRWPYGIAADREGITFINYLEKIYQFSPDGLIQQEIEARPYAGAAFAAITSRYIVTTLAGKIIEANPQADGSTQIVRDMREPVLAVYDRSEGAWGAHELPYKLKAVHPLRISNHALASWLHPESHAIEGLPDRLGDKMAPPLPWRPTVRSVTDDGRPALGYVLSPLSGEQEVERAGLIETPFPVVVRGVEALAYEEPYAYYTLRYAKAVGGEKSTYRAAVIRVSDDARVTVFSFAPQAPYPGYCTQPIAYAGGHRFYQLLLKNNLVQIQEWGVQ